LVRIEEVSGHHNEGGALLASHLAQPPNGAEALTAQLGTLIWIRHAGIGLA
jgi:hypothetical protein